MKYLKEKFMYVLLLIGVTHTSFGQLPTIDGILNSSEGYILAASGSGNGGFDTYSELSSIYYRPDGINEDLYIFVECALANADDTGNDSTAPEPIVDIVNGLALWLDFSELVGSPAGSSLGINVGGEGQLHYLNGSQGFTSGNNIDFKSDCETDYLLAVNTGETASDAYFDVVQWYSNQANDYAYQENFAQSNQTGSVVGNGNGTVWPSNNVMQIAFVNTQPFAGNTGIEFKIPYSQFVDNQATPNTVTSAGYVQFFAAIVSSTGYFSDITADGSAVTTNGEIGFNPDFSTLSGGPFCSNVLVLPLQHVELNGKVIDDEHELTWTKANKESSGLFTLYESFDGIDFQPNQNVIIESDGRYSFSTKRFGELPTYYKISELVNGEEVYSNIIKLEAPRSKGFYFGFYNETNQLTVDADKNQKINEISLYNTFGSLAFQQTDLNTSHFSERLSGLKPGVYFINISTTNNQSSKQRLSGKIIVLSD